MSLDSLRDLFTRRRQEVEELKGLLLRGNEMIEPQAIECILGTRTSILADITAKTDDRNGTNAIWIRGAPGCGKSSLSLTATSMLQDKDRLIAYFRFDRNQATTTTPTALWRFVAYHLGRLLPSVRKKLLRELRNNKVNLNLAMDVFTSLIETPLSGIKKRSGPPLVIVIDALDECGGLAGHSSQDRKVLLQTLARWSGLPKHFKLLVTSRTEGDITPVLSSISIPIDIPSGYAITDNLGAKSSVDASNDIRLFLENRFQDIRPRYPSLPADWPGPEIISGMVDRAAGGFMWATTAANFIDSGTDPGDRLKTIMSGVGAMGSLYSLYTIIFNMAFREISGGEAEKVRVVLGAMVLAKRPLGDMEYEGLPTTEPVTQLVLDGIRHQLRSVISPGPLRFVHKSFDEFLLSEECPPEYRISQDGTHYLLTQLCLKTMTEELRFNICSLETSSLKNADVPDIKTKVATGITHLLSYSCLFFADHLFLTPFDEHLMQQVQRMMLDKLFFWFEAISLLGEINRVSPSLLLILKWSHTSLNEEFNDFLRDACRFVGAFGHPIAQSAPHIYISALPFAPKNSSVAKHFLPQFSCVLALSTGKVTNWPSCIFTSAHHEGNVNCVAFSADKKHFVSGSDDKTICIFDSETGNLVSGPFECDDAVYSICFDPNARQVMAGCKNGKVICWDIETSKQRPVIRTLHEYDVSERFQCRFGSSQTIISAGKTIELWNGKLERCERDWRDGRYRLTSISPDGCYAALVTGQLGTTIRLWKVGSGSKIQGPVDSHHQFKHQQPISALSFSVDSKFAVSGSEDGTIRIWDVRTGGDVGPPFITGTGQVEAVAYSPKNHLVASTDNVVTVWNAATREVVGRLEGHTSSVRDIALSHDGQRVLTASDDKTVRMWDLGRMGGVPAATAKQAHMSKVVALVFSPCGKKLASLDGRSILIQGWDTKTGKSLLKCDTGISYERLIFSPDGSQIVAYQNRRGRGSVGVWNASTGALVARLALNDDTRIDHVAFRSSDGVLVLCSAKGVVRIWSVGNGVPQPQIIAKLPEIIALSPDGLTAIVYDYRRSPRQYVWSTTTHQPLPLILADDLDVSIFPWAYSPSGKFFASSESNFNQGGYTLRVWNMWTGRLTQCFSIIDRLCSLAFSPDDRFIAIAYCTPQRCGKICMFDVSAGQMISGSWSGHTDDISALTFSPDGKTLASGSPGRHVTVWNAAHTPGDLRKFLGAWGDPTRMKDGWVKDMLGNLLFWVPEDHRTGLVWPAIGVLDDSKTTTELDLSRFRYRDKWTECFAGEKRVVEP